MCWDFDLLPLLLYCWGTSPSCFTQHTFPFIFSSRPDSNRWPVIFLAKSRMQIQASFVRLMFSKFHLKQLTLIIERIKTCKLHWLKNLATLFFELAFLIWNCLWKCRKSYKIRVIWCQLTQLHNSHTVYIAKNSSEMNLTPLLIKNTNLPFYHHL